MDICNKDAASEADTEFIDWDSITDTSTFLSFDSYDVDFGKSHIRFSYSYGDSSSSFVFSRFSTYLHLESPDLNELSLKSPAASEAAFSIGMATIPWLWMGLVTKKVVIRAGVLSDDQLGYWRKCFQGVLAEVSLNDHNLPSSSLNLFLYSITCRSLYWYMIKYNIPLYFISKCVLISF